MHTVMCVALALSSSCSLDACIGQKESYDEQIKQSVVHFQLTRQPLLCDVVVLKTVGRVIV